MGRLLRRGWQPPRSGVIDGCNVEVHRVSAVEAPGSSTNPHVCCIRFPGGDWCTATVPDRSATNVRSALAARLDLTVEDLAEYTLLFDGLDSTGMRIWDESESIPDDFWRRSSSRRRTPTLHLRRLHTPAHIAATSVAARPPGLVWLDSEHVMEGLAHGHYPSESWPSGEPSLLGVSALAMTLGVAAHDPHLMSTKRFMQRALKRVLPTYYRRLQTQREALIASMVHVPAHPREARADLIDRVRQELCPLVEVDTPAPVVGSHTGGTSTPVDLASCHMFGVRMQTRVPHLGRRGAEVRLAVGPQGILFIELASFAAASRASASSPTPTRPTLRRVQGVLIPWALTVGATPSKRTVALLLTLAAAPALGAGARLTGAKGASDTTIVLELRTVHAPVVACVVNAHTRAPTSDAVPPPATGGAVDRDGMERC